MSCLRHVRCHFLWFFVCAILVNASSQNVDQAFILRSAENVIRHYNSNSDITSKDVKTVQDFQSFLNSATLRTNVFLKSVLGACQERNNSCTRQTGCPDIAGIFQSFSNNSQLTSQSFMKAIPAVLNAMSSMNCTNARAEASSEGQYKKRPTTGEAWGYSLGFSTVVIILANIGACLGPTMDKRFFRRLLQFLVAMGAGSLTSTSLLVLLPEAFDIIVFDKKHAYVWKATVIISTIYVFFCLERFMKTCMYKRKKLNRNISIVIDEPENNGIDDTSVTPLNRVKEELNPHSHGPHDIDRAARKTFVWMVMVGDVIHNFADGLSIGAAFCEDVTLGVSIALAVVCEELPHELADIAILLHSGLSMKKALLINFLSACFCFMGVAVGVTLGSMSAEASKWIFAMAGGLFLYVPLVDMFPDMSSHVDSLLVSGNNEARVVVFLHACGLTIGAGIVIFIVNISTYIVIQ